jgi:DNA-nicking Smr family endonuclease
MWLADPKLRHIVAAYGEASPAHGGAGALYVRLRGRAERS